MATIRLHKRNKFTTVSNQLLSNEKLSLRAKGLLCYLLSRPDDWTVNVRHLATTCKEGRDAIYKVIDELIAEGYVTREQSKDSGKFAGYDYTVYELPVTGNPLPEKPDTENPTILNTDITKDLKSKDVTPKIEQPTMNKRKISFLKIIIDFVTDNPGKYPKLMYVEFAKYWVEQTLMKKKEILRFEEQRFFDIGRRLSTWIKKVTAVDLNTYWEEEKKLPTLNYLFKNKILGYDDATIKQQEEAARKEDSK